MNLKVDAEKGEGVELAKKYQVKASPDIRGVTGRWDGSLSNGRARPADEFVDKIRKGIDPKWSPEGLTVVTRRENVLRVGERVCLVTDGDGKRGDR